MRRPAGRRENSARHESDPAQWPGEDPFLAKAIGPIYGGRMDLLVDLSGAGDRTTRIYQHLLDGIASGRLPPGAKLPATRSFAAELGVARGTVATAYDRLVAEGYLESRVGAGTFVSTAVGPRRLVPAPTGDVRPRAVWDRLPPAVPDAPPLDFDLSVAGPDTRLFPFAVWRRLVS